MCWGEPVVEQPGQITAETVSFEGAQLLDNVEKDLLHVHGAALRNQRCSNVIATKSKLHQLHQLTDVVGGRRSSAELMVTGSDHSVTQRTALKPRTTLHIVLQKKLCFYREKNGF